MKSKLSLSYLNTKKWLKNYLFTIVATVFGLIVSGVCILALVALVISGFNFY